MNEDSKLLHDLKVYLQSKQVLKHDIPSSSDSISWVKHPEFKLQLEVSFSRPIKSMKFALSEKRQEEGKWIAFYNGQLANLNIELSTEQKEEEIILLPLCITQKEKTIVSISSMVNKQEIQKISEKRKVLRGLQFEKPDYAGNKKKCMNHIVICALSNGRILGISLSTGFLLKSRDKSHQENGLDQGNFLPQELTQNFQKKSKKQTIQINEDLESLKMYFTAPNIRLKRQEVIQKIFSEYSSQLSTDSPKTLALVLLDKQQSKDQGMEKIGKAFERAKNSRCIYFKSSEDLNWIMIKDNFWHFNTSDSIKELKAEYVKYHNNSTSSPLEIAREITSSLTQDSQEHQSNSQNGKGFFQTMINIGDITSKKRFCNPPLIPISVYSSSSDNSPASQCSLQKQSSIQKIFQSTEDIKTETIDKIHRKESSSPIGFVPFQNNKDSHTQFEEEILRSQEMNLTSFPKLLEFGQLGGQNDYQQQSILNDPCFSSQNLYSFPSLQSLLFNQGNQFGIQNCNLFSLSSGQLPFDQESLLKKLLNIASETNPLQSFYSKQF